MAAKQLSESDRLQALSLYQVGELRESKQLTDLTKLAAKISGNKMAIISLLEKDCQKIKASFGVELTGVVLLKDAICDSLVHSQLEYLEILDTKILKNQDTYKSNQYIQTGLVQYYLGFPLIDRQGNRLGAFCVMASEPKTVPATQDVKDQLRILADQAMALIDNERLTKEMEVSQQRLLESSRASLINEMTHSVAHEINNPLTVLLTSVDVLLQQKKMDPVATKLLDSMKNNIASIKKVVSAMKDNHVVNDGLFGSVQGLALDSFDLVSKKFSLQKVNFTLENTLTENHHQISRAVQQVIFHLLQNSAYASLKNPQKDPCVNLWIGKINETVILRVSDSGTGVPEDKIPTLFSGLFHSNYKGEAVGIGLNTCKRIVESINGSIRFVSNGPTTFEVSVPIKLG